MPFVVAVVNLPTLGLSIRITYLSFCTEEYGLLTTANWKKRFNVESKKAQKRNAKNYETDIIIAGSIEALGYFFVLGINNQLFERSSPFVSVTFLYQ